MKIKHTPTRMCMVCRTRHPKNELIRIVKNKNGEINLDKSFKAEGRGAYLCKSEECLAKFVKSRALNRTFKREVQSQFYDKVVQEIKGEN